jgi:hypothetical protein
MSRSAPVGSVVMPMSWVVPCIIVAHPFNAMSRNRVTVPEKVS